MIQLQKIIRGEEKSSEITMMSQEVTCATEIKHIAELKSQMWVKTIMKWIPIK